MKDGSAVAMWAALICSTIWNVSTHETYHLLFAAAWLLFAAIIMLVELFRSRNKNEQ